MPADRFPTIDLIVATVGRTVEPAALLDSIERQRYAALRIVVVDQNEDDRLAPTMTRATPRLLHVRSERGLSRARNAGLAVIEADIVGFPDDDCTYPEGLLERVARRFVERPDLDGLTGRTADATGRSAAGWPELAQVVDREHVWHGGNSATTFLRSELVRRVGSFDESLGLGAGTPWLSGEDTDYLVRALDLGARIEYDPAAVVVHELRGPDGLTATGAREGAAVGYILGKHRYPPRTVARMLIRPLGGALVSLARRDVARARFHASTFRGRARGYFAGRAA